MKKNKFVIAITLIALLSAFFGTGGTQPALAAPVFLSDVAGMSAWYNTEAPIDLSSVSLDTVDVATSDYLIGSVYIDGYAAQYYPHVFVHTDGWIMAFYLNGEPAAKMIDVIGQTLTTTLLDQAVDMVAGTDVLVSHFDFSNPEADSMMLVAEHKDVLDIDNYFVFNIPLEVPSEIEDEDGTLYTYYDKSYAFYQNYYPKFTLNGSNFVLAYDVYAGAPTTGSIYGAFPTDVLLPGVDNLFTVDSFNLTGVVGFGAVLVTYQDLGETFTVAYADAEAAYALTVDDALLILAAGIDCAPAAFEKTSPEDAASNQPLNPTLTWNASNAQNYEYCIDTEDNGDCDTAWVSTGDVESASLNGLLYQTTYYWQVRTSNAFGTTEAGDWFSFTTADGVPPETFVKADPTDGATVSPTGLILDWGESYGAYYYEYCIDTNTDNCGDESENWVSTGTATLATPINLAFGTTYYWQVRAVNDFGTTYAVDFWSFTTTEYFSKLKPADGAVDQRTRVNLSWEKLGTSTYEYCVYAAGDTTPCTGPTDWVFVDTAIKAAVSGLKFSTLYYWQVRATNGTDVVYANDGAWWSFTTKGKPAPANTNSDLIKISPIDGAIDQPTSLTLTWDGAPQAASYEYCLLPVYSTECVWVNTGLTSRYDLVDLDESASYTWQVRAVLTDGSFIYADGSELAFWSFTTITIAAP